MLKTVLTDLCQDHPLRWPLVLAQCQLVLNTAVHSSTGLQPYYIFFGRRLPRRSGVLLPEIPDDCGDSDEARALIKRTQESMTRKYLEKANIKRKNQIINVGDSVWVRRETPIPSTCTKLNYKWDGPLRVTHVLHDGGSYELEDPFMGRQVKRAAEKVKKRNVENPWVLQPRK